MLERATIAVGVALLISVLVSKVSDRFGIPALLLFLILGMLAGSDGPGGIHFDDPALAQTISVVALVLILFSGGLDTEWKAVRPVLRESLILATLGVLLTAVTVGLFARRLLGISLAQGMLLGSIVSSTDAAAVFSVLRYKGISLKGRLKPLLELESGSNDPMAIFLTVGMIQIITQPDLSPLSLITIFLRQMIVGVVLGFAMSKVTLWLVQHLRLGYEGLYPVLTLAMVLLTFGLTAVLGGSGFLAVYLAGIVIGQPEYAQKRSLLHFHDGLAWLMQITLFLTLGLFVFPSRLWPVAGVSLVISLYMMFLARPIVVFVGLLPSALSWREKVFVSWVGLRGAAPLILATFPVLANLPEADLIFHVVFFIVLTSVLLQGASIAAAAKLLGVDAPLQHPSDEVNVPEPRAARAA